jgi:anti-sigma-K factor RskA
VADHAYAGLTCADVLELSGSFVLGALTPEEMDAVRAHLAGCPEAHAEMAELGSVVPALFESVEPVAPPPGLKARLLDAAAAEQQAMAATDRADRSFKPFPGAEIQRRGFDVGALFRRPIWAGIAAAALVAAVALGALSLQLGTEVENLSAYRNGVVEVLEEAARPGAQLAILAAPESAPGPKGLAAVGADGSVAMVVRDLAPTTGTQVYTAWLIGAEGTPIPVGDFVVDDSRTASFTTAHATLGPGVTVAVSLEPRAGATTPTMVVAAGRAQAQAS